jgi:cysteine-rich repeat protein
VSPHLLSFGLALALALVPTAARAACGDGVLDTGEGCDDLNLTDGDGCDATCAVEAGWECVDASFDLDYAEVLARGDTTHVEPSWALSADGRTVTQSRNAFAAVYVTTLPAAGVSMTFDLTVQTSSDDDFIGWAVGYDAGESADTGADWLLFDWKQTDQTWGGYDAYAGLRLYRVEGAIDDSYEIWAHDGDVLELARAATLGSTGWSDFTTYTVQVDYSTTQLDVWVDGTLEFSESGSFPIGNFAFYNFSQEGIEYTLVAPVDQSVCAQMDSDGDGWFDLEDCDPADPAVNAPATWYADADADGYGDAGSPTAACSLPSGHVADSTDCDDTDATAYPGATEYCDGVDDDCDGTVDDNAYDATTWYLDRDGDGYGCYCSTPRACTQPSGYAALVGDCYDYDATRHPGADEYCDGHDDDCDGSTDEADALDAVLWYLDADGDGYGDPGSTAPGCSAPSGYVADATDCDDADATAWPGATETCDGTDDDCDGTVDEADAVDAATWYADADGDGWGEAGTTAVACGAPSGFVAGAGDCDDTQATVHPGAAELCGGADEDCDGFTDEEGATGTATWYADGDGDGWGDPTAPLESCAAPSGTVADASDCDDSDPSVNPGAAETWYDGTDQDCDGRDDDQDEDGYLLAQDCDDTDPSVHPDAKEVWYDGIDQDCDGASDYDLDGDGYDSETYGGDDCDDADPDTFPGAPDTPYDGVIQDCDHASDYDADSDGYDALDWGGEDCDDANSEVHPEAEEAWYDGIDQDCDGNDDDQDEDGWPLDEDCDDTDPDVWPGAPGWSEDCFPLGGDSDTGTGEPAGKDCGCAASGRSAGLALPLVLLPFLLRRRRC